ncbi:MAG: DUF1292 domain-containing protein [Bacillota bacterium]|nr:DUF1292 domain-containing protein [Bacillota bacterium]
MAEDQVKEEIFEEDEPEYLTLEFDNGDILECEILGIYPFNGKEYMALLPDDGTDDVLLYEYKEISEEEFDITDIEDDAEYEAAAAEFDRLVAED